MLFLFVYQIQRLYDDVWAGCMGEIQRLGEPGGLPGEDSGYINAIRENTNHYITNQFG